MKIHNFVVLLSLSWQITLCVRADETNELYVTDDNGRIYADPKAHYDQLVAEAKKTRESLPAKDFPEGNWGESVNGLQLSLRFANKTYVDAEKITAVLLVRNTTNRYVQYIDSPDGYRNGDGRPILFVVTTAAGKIITPEQKLPPVYVYIGGFDYLIAPQTQRKYIELLSRRYHLTNGTYFVHASVKTTLVKARLADGKPDKIELPEVKSADVPIKIVGSK